MTVKTDRELLLQVALDVAAVKQLVAHHLGPTCLRHEKIMDEHTADLKSLNNERWLRLGIATLLPAVISMGCYIYFSHKHEPKGKENYANGVKMVEPGR